MNFFFVFEIFIHSLLTDELFVIVSEVDFKALLKHVK